MHYVSKISAAAALTPKIYDKVSTGFRRATYVDHAMGSVHMGVGVCFLAPGGSIQPHVHSFEESFFVLEGNITTQIGEKSHTLAPGDFGLIRTGVRHSWHNESGRPVRWLEMQAPQPRPLEYGRDTFFGNGNVPAAEGDALLGHFDESQLPQ